MCFKFFEIFGCPLLYNENTEEFVFSLYDNGQCLRQCLKILIDQQLEKLCIILKHYVVNERDFFFSTNYFQNVKNYKMLERDYA